MDVAIYWAVIVVGLPLAAFLLGREGYCWWLEREARQRFYKDMRDGAIRYVEELYSGKVDRP